MQGIGIISIISASIYVSMMALYYAGILASQSEFEKEVRKHLETAGQLRDAAIEADRGSAAKSEFLAKMSHELRTPLNAVIGYSEMLLEDTDRDADPQGVEDLNKIHRAGRHLLGLVNAILDLSKIEAGKMEVFPEAIDVSSMVGNVADRWRRDERMFGRVIETDVGDGLGEIDADPGKLEQVLDALIGNAVCYAPESNITIVVRSTTTGAATPSIQIQVEDEGPGIAVELMPRLFETFNDFNDSSASKYGGPGLGLPLCHRLCGLMSVQLSVRSVPGEGTSVSLLVPREGSAASLACSDEVGLTEAA